MKILKKALAVLLAMLMVLSVTAVSAFAEGEDVIEEDVIEEPADSGDINPFALIGRFFERIADLFTIIFQFLENLFTGTGDKSLGDL